MQEYHSLLRVVAETIYTTASAFARHPLAVRTYVYNIHVIGFCKPRGQRSKRKKKKTERKGKKNGTERNGKKTYTFP